MNERVPDSSGLPLRAMVMVLLFLGVIFLLVGFQAMGSAATTPATTAPRCATVTTTSAAPTTVGSSRRRRPRCGCSTSPRWQGAAEPHRRPAAGRRLERHRDRQPAMRRPMSRRRRCTSATADGEQAAAEAVGKVLERAGRTANPGSRRAATGRDRLGHRLGSRPWSARRSLKSAAAVLFAAPVALLSACAPPGKRRRHLAGHHAVGLDRVAGAQCGAGRRKAEWAKARTAPRAARRSSPLR